MKQEKVKVTCAFSGCDVELDEEKAVCVWRGKVRKYTCSFRHLYRYLVETFTTGNQINEGLE